HECNTCSQNFKRAEHLARHLLTHSGLRPFQCSRCPKAFSRLDALKRHGKVHLSTPP
ncbi:hypothetical protein EDD86DRAFT_173001, partial [Gorgonomyces haynaldii]